MHEDHTGIGFVAVQHGAVHSVADEPAVGGIQVAVGHVVTIAGLCCEYLAKLAVNISKGKIQIWMFGENRYGRLKKRRDVLVQE